MDWLTVTPQARYERLQTDWPPGMPQGGTPPDGWDDWADYQRACTAEGMCPVCTGPLAGPGPKPGYAIAAGNCRAGGCPAAPCRWAITVPYPSGLPGALMYAPLGADEGQVTRTPG